MLISDNKNPICSKMKLVQSLFLLSCCSYIDTGCNQLNFVSTDCGYHSNVNRNHRGLRHYWGLRVRGQHTKTTGRRGKTVGVSKKR